jgi:lipase chaperone LimK
MRAWELLVESNGRKKINEAMAMREYAHPEEYLIRDGVDAGIEILQELKDDIAQPETLNVKWDGKAAIFWGRDEQGQFYMIPNNQWNKGQKLSQEELAGEIQRTGRKLPSQSDEEFAAIRSQMAANYSAQWNALEKSSPRQGFYWGDIMLRVYS